MITGVDFSISRYSLTDHGTYQTLIKTSYDPNHEGLERQSVMYSDIDIQTKPSYPRTLQELSEIFGGAQTTLKLLSESDLWTAQRENI